MNGIKTMVWMVGTGLLLAGCATSAHNTKAQEAEVLKTQVASLQDQVSQLDQRVEELSQKQESLEASAGSSNQPGFRSKGSPGVLSPRQIQVALKNGGYYNGPIDGKLGPQTREAIKAFQKSRGLNPDGIVGSRPAAALAKIAVADSS